MRTTLAARVLDTGGPPGWMEGHVAQCLRCQAVVAQSLRFRRSLAHIHPPDELEGPPVRSQAGWLAAGAASMAAAAVVVRHLRQQSG